MSWMNENMIKNSVPDNVYFSAFDIFLVEPLSKNDIVSFVQDLKNSSSKILDAQAFKYNSLLSEAHLLSAIWHSWTGFKNNMMISGSLSVEFLLYASGQRQISKALDFFGIGGSESKFSVVLFQNENIIREEIFTHSSFIQLINKVENLSFVDSLEKRKNLSRIFNYKTYNSMQQLNDSSSLKKLENYILTSISNLVFESPHLKEIQNTEKFD